jgi:hypothetical protein
MSNILPKRNHANYCVDVCAECGRCITEKDLKAHKISLCFYCNRKQRPVY